MRRHPLRQTHRGLYPGPDPGVSCGDRHTLSQFNNDDSDILRNISLAERLCIRTERELFPTYISTEDNMATSDDYIV